MGCSLFNFKQLLFSERIKTLENTDRVLIYFAGHGIARNSDEEPKGYLIPHDAQPDKPET